MPNNKNTTSKGDIPTKPKPTPKPTPSNPVFPLPNNWEINIFKRYLSLDGAAER